MIHALTPRGPRAGAEPGHARAPATGTRNQTPNIPKDFRYHHKFSPKYFSRCSGLNPQTAYASFDFHWGAPMRIALLSRVLAIAGAAIVLTACQSSQGMDDQAIAYNKAVANSTNEFFLLNALRAKDRFPVYYTRTTGNNASESLSPGASITATNWVQTPTLTLNASGSNTQSLGNLDDQRFMRGVLAPVPLSIMESYVGQGWPSELLMMMFIKKFKIDKELVTYLTAEFDSHCNGKTAAPLYCKEGNPLSKYINDPTNHCLISVDGKNVVFDNYPGNPDQLECFQSMLRVMLALGFTPADGTKYTVIASAMPPSSADLKGLSQAATAKLAVSEISKRRRSVYAICTKKDVSGFTFDKFVFDDSEKKAPGENAATVSAQLFSRTLSRSLDLSGQIGGVRSPEEGASLQSTTSLIAPEMPTSCAKQLTESKVQPTDSKKSQEVPAFEVTTRSLDSMIYYLGEDLRAKKKSARDVEIWVGEDEGDGKNVPLFVAGDTPDDAPLVSVRYRGADYNIPHQDSGRSLQVLSLLNQIWGLQKEATEAPSIPVVSVINSQ